MPEIWTRQGLILKVARLPNAPKTWLVGQAGIDYHLPRSASRIHVVSCTYVLDVVSTKH